MTFGLACCAIEMIGTFMANHDLDRFGIVPWPSPRQSDVMVVSGTVTKKMAPAIKLLYEQMPNPKYVISMGACATNGGPYTEYDRVLQGVDKIIPVDVYVPGCPAAPRVAARWVPPPPGEDHGREEDGRMSDAPPPLSLPSSSRSRARRPDQQASRRIVPADALTFSETKSDVDVSVAAEHLLALVTALKDRNKLKFDYLRNIAGVDYEAEGMALKYHLYSFDNNLALQVTVADHAGPSRTCLR